MRGKLVVITGSSGSGKSTVVKALLERIPQAGRLTTVTTRVARPDETNGQDYFFISRQEFERKIAADEFFEWALVYGELYGSTWQEVESALISHAVVFAVLDIQGASTVMGKIPEATVIFIRPQDRDELVGRLIARNAANADTGCRFSAAAQEIKAARLFHYTVVNAEGKLQETVDAVYSIIQSRL